MADKEYTIGCLSLFDVANSPTHIGLTNVGFPANAEVSDDGSGGIYAEHQSITGFAPVASATTKYIQQILALIGLNGQCVGPGLAVTKVDLIHRMLENCSTALSGTPHLRDRCTKGLLRLGALSCDRGKDATLSIILDTLSDGVNGPVARTDGVAMPTGLVSERHTLGVSLLAGTPFPKVDNVSLEFNVAIDEKMPAEASIWAETVGVLTVRPYLVLRHRNLAQVANALLQIGATAANHNDTMLQLVKRQNQGAFEDFNDPVHTRITLAGLIYPEDLATAAAGQKSTGAIRLPAAFDGTNAPLVISTTATYDPTP